jgi:hypothetical protein
METVAVIEKTKTITVKIIGNESENDFSLFRSLSRLSYLTGNLPSVITDTTHTLGPIDPHLNMSIHLHTQAHMVNIFWKETIRQVFHAYRNKKAIMQSANLELRT